MLDLELGNGSGERGVRKGLCLWASAALGDPGAGWRALPERQRLHGWACRAGRGGGSGHRGQRVYRGWVGALTTQKASLGLFVWQRVPSTKRARLMRRHFLSLCLHPCRRPIGQSKSRGQAQVQEWRNRKSQVAMHAGKLEQIRGHHCRDLSMSM